MRSQRAFVFGLLDWNGPALPTADDLAGSAVIQWGTAHIKAITEHEPGLILGRCALLTTNDDAARHKSHEAGGTVWVYRWGHFEGPASRVDRATLPIMGSWGYGYARAVAEAMFGSDAEG